MKILIVDDDRSFAALVQRGLQRAGYETVVVHAAEQALAAIERDEPALVLLDVMMPRLPGTEACKQIRRISRVPIIMLTAVDDETDVINALDSGADDYVRKPFKAPELLARIRVQLRRAAERMLPEQRSILKAGAICLDTDSATVTLEGETIHLARREYDLLRVLMASPEVVLSRKELLRLAWGDDSFIDIRTVDVHIRRLREKIEAQPGAPVYILTVSGMGYRFHNPDGAMPTDSAR